MRLHKKYRSSLHYVLSGLVPYSEANLKLSFSPNRFFNDLEMLNSNDYRAATLQGSYYRAIKNGLVEISDGMPRLTADGKRRLDRYQPQLLPNSAAVLLIFDIPESHRQLRNRLRATLRELYFTQVQQSVWQTEYDVIEYLTETIQAEGLEEYVQIYEAIRIL